MRGGTADSATLKQKPTATHTAHARSGAHKSTERRRVREAWRGTRRDRRRRGGFDARLRHGARSAHHAYEIEMKGTT